MQKGLMYPGCNREKHMCKESTSIDTAQLLAGREELQETDGEGYEFIDPNDISDDDDTEGDVTQGPLSTRHELTADAW